MIEQQQNQLVLTFPSPEAATAFAQFLVTLLNPSGSGEGSFSASSAPASASPPTSDSPEVFRSRHTVLTPERQDQIAAQRAAGMTERQRLLRAQTTLRDGTLPFRQLPTAPQPTGQPSPRQKAQQEGGFADGAPVAVPKTRLKPTK